MPVSADKKPPESKNYVERIIDFSGGLNTTISGSLLSKSEAQVATDISFEQKGTLKPRRGRLKRYANSFTPDPITGLGVYYKNDGTSHLIMAAGDSLYSDTPHMSIKWDVKSEWEQEGSTKLGFATTSLIEGSVTSRKQAWGISARCEDDELWFNLDTEITYIDEDCPYSSFSGSLQVELEEATGYAYKLINLDSNKTRHMGLTGFVKNIDADSGIRLVGLDADNSVIKASSYVIGTAWTNVILKVTPTELEDITKFGVEVKGSIGQKAQYTGLYYNNILETEYNYGDYSMPDITHYELYPFEYLYDDNRTFSEGVLAELVNDSGLTLDKAYLAGVEEFNTKAHFDLGLYNNTSGAEVINSVVLSRKTS